MKIINVNFDSHLLEPFKNLKTKDLSGEKFYIAESEKVIKHILGNGHKPLKILLNEKFLSKHEEMLKQIQCDLLLCSNQDLKKITGYQLHHGIIAMFERPAYKKIQDMGNKIIILNGITSAENVGNIMRNAAGLGFTSLIFDSYCSNPFHKRSIRVSIGHITTLDIHRTEQLPQTLDELKKNNYAIIGSSSKGSSLNSKSFKNRKVALVLGSEGEGMDKELNPYLDHTLAITLNENVSSLNVASASALLMYEINNLIKLS